MTMLLTNLARDWGLKSGAVASKVVFEGVVVGAFAFAEPPFICAGVSDM